MTRRNIFDSKDTWWTIDQAAAHFGITRASVLRWIRESDLQVYVAPWDQKTKYLQREDVLAEFRARRKRQAQSLTRGRDTPQPRVLPSVNR